ncbi:hypothetical protein [Streptomyces sp. NPDC102360]|uniref:hypothetical protein n=1 Tax=Streptomyces sp. NPDC102360 TaxID=3366160 RepID=UPI00381329AF
MGVVRGLMSLVALAGAVALSVVAYVGPVENAVVVIPLVMLAYLVAIGLAGPWIGRCVIALCAVPLRVFGGAPGELTVAGSRARARRLSARRSSEALAALTGREREVLSAMAEGRTNAAIATQAGRPSASSKA